MLSYGALLENSTGQNFSISSAAHLGLYIRILTHHLLLCKPQEREQRLQQRELLPLATAVNPSITLLATVATTPASEFTRTA